MTSMQEALRTERGMSSPSDRFAPLLQLSWVSRAGTLPVPCAQGTYLEQTLFSVLPPSLPFTWVLLFPQGPAFSSLRSDGVVKLSRKMESLKYEYVFYRQ